MSTTNKLNHHKHSWMNEFYTELSEESMKSKTWLEAAEHSLQKWKGLLPENLAAHGVESSGKAVYTIPPNYPNIRLVGIDSQSCALCYKGALDEHQKDEAYLAAIEDIEERAILDIALIYEDGQVTASSRDSCFACPLYQQLGHGCDETRVFTQNVFSPFQSYITTKNPKPMIELLEKTVDRIRQNPKSFPLPVMEYLQSCQKQK